MSRRNNSHIEKTFIKLSNSETLRKARKVLSDESILCCYNSGEHSFSALFLNAKESLSKVAVSWKKDFLKDAVPNLPWDDLKSGDLTGHCDCGENSDRLCFHAIAALMHYHHHHEKKRSPQIKQKEEPPVYQGLKSENLDKITHELNQVPKGELLIKTSYSFPHAPSKWNKFIFSVALRIGKKEYVGNLGNLRQLHFEKSLVATLSLKDFSLQDRQIIRFLAINSEPDGRNLALDSEQTAELFHCLRSFNNFILNDEQINIRDEQVELALVFEKCASGRIARPALVFQNKALPLKKSRLIFGRSGCWVGVGGEYWWLPASVDIAWMRNFLRIEEPVNNPSWLKYGNNNNNSMPVKVLSSENKPKLRSCQVLMDIETSSEKEFNLSLFFNYNGSMQAPDGLRLICDENELWLRNASQEQAIVEKILLFGCKTVKNSPHLFRIKNLESFGLFLDYLIPELLGESNSIFLSAKLATLCAGGSGLPSLPFSCVMTGECNDYYELDYNVGFASKNISWRELCDTVKGNRSYLMTRKNQLAVISPELSKLVSSTADFVKVVKGSDHRIKIPRAMAPFWCKLASEIQGATPMEFKNLSQMMTPNTSDIEIDPTIQTKLFKGELRKYQSEAVAWISKMAKHKFNVILADEMGLGKTVQTLALLAAYKNCATRKKRSMPSLVLCPTTLVENWAMETRKFLPKFKVLSIKGSQRDKLWKKMDKYDLLITSYNIAKRDIDKLKHERFKFLILDEAQQIKNPSTANAKASKSIKSDHRLALTGTPLENRPEELWSIFDFLQPNMLGTYGGFKKRYGSKLDSRERNFELGEKTAPFIIRRKKIDVCAELPAKYEQILCCEMEASQRQLYESLLLSGREQCKKLIEKKEKGFKFQILTILMRLRQICCHPGILPDEIKPETPVSSAKMDLLRELLYQSIDEGHKILLFSQFTSMLKIIRTELDEKDVLYEYLDGSTQNRMDRVNNFNNDDRIKVFLLSLKAGGTGLNLTSADTVIIYDPWWNPAVESQATDRTHRIGQKRPVHCMKLLVKDSIEEKIIGLQKKKQEIFNDLIDNPAVSLSQIDIDDFQYLFE